jgi:DNA-binding transcriptional LysR family regulator
MHLTDAGRIYFEQVSRALREIENAELALRDVQGTPRGVVRMSTIAEPFLERLLFDFLDKYPDVSLELDKSHGRVDLVADGFDLAVRAGVLEDSSLVAHKLRDVGPILCGSPQYLKARGTPTVPLDLRSHDCIVVGTSATATTWTLASGDGSQHRIAVSGRLAVNALSTAVEACRRGLGIGLFPAAYVEPLILAGELSVVLRGFTPPPAGLYIVHPSRTLLAPAVRTLIDFLKLAFKTDRSLLG